MFFSAAKGHEILKYAGRDLGHLGNIPGTGSCIIAINFDLHVVLFTISGRQGSSWLSQPSLMTFPSRSAERYFMLCQNLNLCTLLCSTSTTGWPHLQSLHYNICLNFSSLGSWVLDLRFSKKRASWMKWPDSCSRPSQTVRVFPCEALIQAHL